MKVKVWSREFMQFVEINVITKEEREKSFEKTINMFLRRKSIEKDVKSFWKSLKNFLCFRS